MKFLIAILLRGFVFALKDVRLFDTPSQAFIKGYNRGASEKAHLEGRYFAVLGSRWKFKKSVIDKWMEDKSKENQS